jgi:hypothetical protein
VWDATQKVRRIQQDTNPPPVKDARITNLAWANMATCGWDVAIIKQTVNSPDCNTSDLAIFSNPVDLASDAIKKQ